VPTLAERIATLETQVRALRAEISGGDGTPYAASLRGRVHEMRSSLASAVMVERAAETAARAQREAAHMVEVTRGRRLSRWTQLAIALAAIATAAYPYVGPWVR
jgi:hypothetical protein